MHNQGTISGMGGAPRKSPLFYTRKHDDTTDTSATTATTATTATNLLGNTLGTDLT